MRTLLAAAAAVLLLLGVTPVHAAGAAVEVADMAFTPATVEVGLGETVTWRFADATSHTATSDDGFFDTGAASGGASRSVRFASAGTFTYHCTFHPMMRGRVVVAMAATGSRADGWRLRWLAGTSPKGRTYDVQVRRVGSDTWRSFEKATTKGSARFDPGSGTWRARARTHEGTATSGWSPVLRLS